MSVSPSTSPPRTPGERILPVKTNTPNSDDSSIIDDLSFDYIFDQDGNFVRLSKGSTSKSNHSSSPPTPQEGLQPDPPKSPSPDLLSPVRRGSLSRSESAFPILTGTGAGTSSTSGFQNEKAARSFQRVASGPVASTPSYLAPTVSSLSKPRATARRITLEDNRERHDSLSVLRAGRQTLDSNPNPYSLQEEKENIHAGDDHHYMFPSIGTASKLQPRNSPPLVTRSMSSASSRLTATRASYLSTGSSSTSAVSRPHDASVPQRAAPLSHSRQIMPGPNRAGRIMKSASSAAKFSSNVSNYDRISEIESSDNEFAGGIGALTATGGEDTEPEDELAGATEPAMAPSPSSNGLRTRLQPTSSASGLLVSGPTRPRRSASLSDALTNDDYHLQVQHQYQNTNSRPGTSLGMTGESAGARRVTTQQRERQDQELRSEYKSQEDFDRQSPSPTHQQPPASRTTTSYGHRRRDSDTLRNMSTPLSANSIGSPTVVEHHRTSPPITRVSSLQVRHSPPNTLAIGRSSPPAVKGRVSPASRGRLSPSASSNVGVAREVAKHRRSPTAPEPSREVHQLQQATGKTWAGAGGDRVDKEQEEERDAAREREKEKGRKPHQSHLSLQTGPSQSQHANSAPQLAVSTQQPQQISNGQNQNQAQRHIVVNKKAYARLDCIGKGGSSRVYRVMNHTNELYAIKRVALDKTDAETMSGYMNEIALLKRLEGNSRIIRLVDSELRPGPGGNKGHLLLVMECGEIDLAKLLQEQMKDPLNMVWVAYYWQQMLQAVHVIHEEKIVHSDLKPANFVLVRGQLKLIDFGIANAIANDTTNIQRDHQIGTVNYMSPEAIELPDGMRRLKVGRPSDVWSLGCILYQMIYGAPPFHHLKVYQKMKAIPDGSHVIQFDEYAVPIDNSPNSLSASQQPEPPRRLEHLKVRVRRDVIESIKCCMRRDPKERSTIPDLLNHRWLAMDESPAPPVEHMLKQDETVINPYYMRQLLEYGISLSKKGGALDPESLLKDAERLVQELKALQMDSVTHS